MSTLSYDQIVWVLDADKTLAAAGSGQGGSIAISTTLPSTVWSS